ncbi:MAG TPA: DNA internalization-related competence protein ComEC/Rec2 [Polyangiaceae bacterium]
MLLDPVLLAATALVFGGAAAVYPLATTVAAGLVLLLLAARFSARARAIAIVAFAVGALRAGYVLRSFESARVVARDALGAPSRCDLEGIVTSSPVWLNGAASYTVDLTRGECIDRRLPRARVHLYGGPDAIGRGDRVHAIADLAPLQLFRNLGAADPTPSAARSGVVMSGGVLSLDVLGRGFGLRSYIDRARAKVRRRIVASFVPEAEAMARALVLGESDLPEQDTLAFQQSGLSHMLAVSGTHLVFAVASLVHALGFVLVRIEALACRFIVRRFAALCGVALALVYADFAGGSGSAWRAALMLSAAFLAEAVGRRPATLRSFAVSLIVVACLDPLCIFDLSFGLSVAATSGLLWLGRPLSARCDRVQSTPLRFLAKSFAVTLSATIPCAPLLALLASGVTLAGLVANVLAAPVGEAVALPLCLSYMVFAPFPAIERGTALVASGALLIVRKIARYAASARYLALTMPEPNRYELAVLVVLLAGLVALRGAGLGAAVGRRSRVGWLALGVGALLCVELATRRAGQPRGLLRATALDVGQGDSNLIDLPDGEVMLIDGGGFVGSPVDPGKAVVLPVLRSRRRTRIDVAVLSHPHPDHFTGLRSALAEVDVGEFWDTGQGEAEGAGPIYAELIASLRRRGVPILRPAELCDRPRTFGGAVVRVLAPCPSFTPRRGANDNSLVLSVQFGERRMLFTGDAEREEEGELLARYPQELRADYLKAGHHGSRTSSSDALLASVNPELATLSCGVRNRFGHPHLPTLARLAEHGVLALRLDRTGSVQVETNGHELTARAVSVPY